MIISGLLSWSFDNRILGDISVRFYPAGIQLYAMMFGVLAVILGVLLLRRPPWMSPARGLRILGITAIVFLVWVLGSIAYKTGGLINLNEGGWVALVGAVLITLAGTLSPDVDIDVRTWPRLQQHARDPHHRRADGRAALRRRLHARHPGRRHLRVLPGRHHRHGRAACSAPASAATSASSRRTTGAR